MIQTSLLVTKEKQTLDINIFIHNDCVINFMIFDIIQYLCISALQYLISYNVTCIIMQRSVQIQKHVVFFLFNAPDLNNILLFGADLFCGMHESGYTHLQQISP